MHDTLTGLVQELQSGQEWQRALATAAKFHRYSFGNSMLIAASHARAFEEGRVPDPVPDLVAGYQTWQALGRQVVRGQRGHTILAPRARTIREAVDAAGGRRSLGRGERPRPGETTSTRRAVTGWSTATVFSMSQTEGADLPLPPRPQLLVGEAPDGLWEGLAAQVTHAGYTLTDAPDAAAIGGANGVTNVSTSTVTIRADMDPAARAKTLSHELAHVLMHAPDLATGGLSAQGLHRGAREVEAESVAFIVGAAHGMDSSTYTLPYVATWAGGTDPAGTVRASAERVVRTARGVLDTLTTDHGLGGQPPGVDQLVHRRQPRDAAMPAAANPTAASPAGPGVGR